MEAIVKTTEKRCPRCGCTLPASEFYRSSFSKDGLGAYCKKCSYEYQLNWRGGHKRDPNYVPIMKRSREEVAAYRKMMNRIAYERTRRDPVKLQKYLEFHRDYMRRKRGSRLANSENTKPDE
jgi:hypothetical protein